MTLATSELQAALAPQLVMPLTEKTTIPESMPRMTMTMRSSTSVKPDSLSDAADSCEHCGSPDPKVVPCEGCRFCPCPIKNGLGTLGTSQES